MAERDGGPVCVVTGGSAGIGLAAAREFGRRGHRVVICGRSAETLAEASKHLAAVAPGFLALQLDVAEPNAPARLVDAAVKHFGRLDVLVNNAGAAPMGPLDQLAEADFEEAVAVNVAAIFRTTRAAWPVMKRQGGGVLVNISSLASVDPFPGFSVYGACKAWVNLFTRAAADEGRPHGIRVFSLALGAVETRLLRGLFADFPAEQALSPEEVARLVAALCDEPMRHASGQTLFVRK